MEDILVEIMFLENFLDEIKKLHKNDICYALTDEKGYPVKDFYVVIVEEKDSFIFYYKNGKKNKTNKLKYKFGEIVFYQLSKKFYETDIYVLEKVENEKIYLWNGLWTYDNMFDINENIDEEKCKKSYKIISIGHFMLNNVILIENFDFEKYRLEKLESLIKRKTFNHSHITPFIRKKILELLDSADKKVF